MDIWSSEDDKSVHARFMKRLIVSRARTLMRDQEYLKKLRFRYDDAMKQQRLFGAVWADYGTDVFRLIAEAHDEVWDAEDEEKHAGARPKKEAPVNQKGRNHDDLVAAREEGTRERIDLVQGKLETGLGELEENEGGSLAGALWRKEEEAAPQKEEEVRGVRGEGFYRRAGCT